MTCIQHPSSSPALFVKKGSDGLLIQDSGRFGYSQFGVTQSGAVDEYAYCWANHLLDNPINCATIEITLGQCEFVFEAECEIALCGGDLNAKLDGVAIGNWISSVVQQGQVLKFGLPRNGLRAYLAIKRGFNVNKQLGSVSTLKREQLGGIAHGQPLKTGDRVPFYPQNPWNNDTFVQSASYSNSKQYGLISSQTKRVGFQYQIDYNAPLHLRVIEGYQADTFPSSTRKELYSQQFTISQHADRMGYRLDGSRVTPSDKKIMSEGIALGAIQIPPDGSPIILLNDRQTIGGYPKLGCIARVDLPRLAQAKPGQVVTFSPGNLEQLQHLWCRWARFFGY